MVHRSLPQGSETRQVLFLCTKTELWAVGAGLVSSECDRQKVLPIFFIYLFFFWKHLPFPNIFYKLFPTWMRQQIWKTLGRPSYHLHLPNGCWLVLSVQLKTTQMATFQNARFHTCVVFLSCQPARLAILLSAASVKQRYTVLQTRCRVSRTFWNPPHTSGCKYCRAERGRQKKTFCYYISLTTGRSQTTRCHPGGVCLLIEMTLMIVVRHYFCAIKLKVFGSIGMLMVNKLIWGIFGRWKWC